MARALLRAGWRVQNGRVGMAHVWNVCVIVVWWLRCFAMCFVMWDVFSLPRTIRFKRHQLLAPRLSTMRYCYLVYVMVAKKKKKTLCLKKKKKKRVWLRVYFRSVALWVLALPRTHRCPLWFPLKGISAFRGAQACYRLTLGIWQAGTGL